MAVDMDKLNGFIGQFAGDLGAAVHAGMVVIGERLGLYKALVAGPMTSSELAAKTGTDARYAREWLASQAAGSYVIALLALLLCLPATAQNHPAHTDAKPATLMPGLGNLHHPVSTSNPEA